MAYKSPYDFASRITSNISYDGDGNAYYDLQKPSVAAPQTTLYDDDGPRTGNDPNYAFDWNSNQWVSSGLQQAAAALSKQYEKVDWNYNDISGDRAAIGSIEPTYNEDEYTPAIRGFGVNDIWGGTRYTSGWVTSLDHLDPTQREANVIAGQARDKLWQTYDNMVQQGHQPEKTPDQLAIEFYVKNGGNQTNDPYGPGVNTAALSEVLTQQFMNQPSVLAVTGKPYVTNPEKLTSINDFAARHSSPQVLNTFAVFGRQHVSRDIIGDVLMGVMMAVATWGIGTAVSLAASTAALGAEAVTGILAAAEASGISVASALATALPGVNVVSAVAVAEMTGGNPLTAAITAGFDSVGSSVKGDVFNSITSNFPDIPVPVVNAVTNATIAAGKAGLTGQDWETAVTNSLTSSAIGVGATAIGQDIPPTLIKAIVPVIGTAITGGDVTKAIINAGIQNAGSLFKDSAEQDFKNLDDKLERGKTLTVEENDRLYNFYSNFNKPPDSDQPKVITDLDKEPITKSAEILAQEEAGTKAIRDNTIFSDSSGVTGTQTDASPITSGLSVFGSGDPEAPKGETVTDFSDLVLPPLTEAPTGKTVTDFSDLVLPPLTKEKATDFSDLVLPPLTKEKATDFSDLVERPASDELVSTDIPANVGDIAASLPIPEAAPKSPLETMAPPVELPAVVPEAPVATDPLTTGIAPEAPVGGLNAVAPTTPEEKMANSMGLELTDITKPLVATAGSLLKRARSQPKKPAPRAPVARPTGALQLVKSPSKIAPPAKMDVSKLIPIQKAAPIAPPKTLASNAKLTPITNIATLTSLLKRA